MIDSNEMQLIRHDVPDDARFLEEAGFTAPAGKGDFAILKLQNVEKLACAKVASRRSIKGEKVWTYSYPFFERNGAKSLPLPYYTEGRINDPPTLTLSMDEPPIGDRRRAFWEMLHKNPYYPPNLLNPRSNISVSYDLF